MNRNFLKEAIADAKAVKESAIANAKAALEESFTPHLKSMLSTKLQEMEKEDDMKENMRGSFEEDDVKEMMRDSYEEDDVKEAKSEKNDKMEEEMSNPVMRKGLKGDDPAELETEKMRMKEEELDEVLSELEESEEVNEDARTDAEEEGYKDGMEDEKEDLESEEVDLEDMTDDDLKKFIEDVIEDMVSAGEIEAGENFEDEVDVTVDDEVDVDVEVEDEVEVTESKEVNESEEVTEVVGTAVAGVAALVAAAGGLAKVQMAMEDPETRKKYPKLNAFLGFMGELGSAASAAKMREAKDEKASDDELEKIEDKMDQVFGESKDSSIDEEMKKDLDEAYTTIETLRTDLNEINLLNAKLLYTNKIFKSKNLNENDKVKVLENFDKATTVQEAKLIFETMKDLKPKKVKKSIKENLGRASKSAGIAPKKSNPKPIVESTQMVDRFKKLAGII
jgi:hypothetical protein